MAGRVCSLSSRSEQALSWPKIAEIPLQGLKSAEAFVFRTRAEVSELLAHDESGGGLLFLQKTHSLRPEHVAE